MNKYIYKVIKWLEDHESVSQAEMDKNKHDAISAYADTYQDAAAAAAAVYATYYAYASASTYGYTERRANHWVNKYLKITGENKQDYLDKIEAEK